MERRLTILNAIIKEFIETAEPVGSQAIVMGYHLSVSPATIRNDMCSLEEEGLIFQPHTSAGRIPTDTGYRLYVDELADYETAEKQAIKTLEKVLLSYEIQKAREKIYDGVRILSQATGHASFATLPDNRRTFYLGISNVLRQPEFSNDPVRASQVVEVLEDTDNFINTLRALEIGDATKIFIGKENILPQIQSCAVVVTKYKIGDFEGFLGIMGPTRMKYPFNHAMVRKVKALMEN
ncbi:MAG: DeoR family transcriptional regulator [Candidatus Gracilibacteria bacterium]